MTNTSTQYMAAQTQAAAEDAARFGEQAAAVWMRAGETALQRFEEVQIEFARYSAAQWEKAVQAVDDVMSAGTPKLAFERQIAFLKDVSAGAAEAGKRLTDMAIDATLVKSR